MVDIKRDAPKKTRRNVVIAVGVGLVAVLTVWLSRLEARPPSVPEGASRLRLSLSYGHTQKMIDELLTALGKHK